MNKLNEIILLFIFTLVVLWVKHSHADSIKVMVVDTGVSISSPEIKNHIKEPFNIKDYIDDEGHGTGIASIVIKDTCTEVELISCRYFELPKISNFKASIDCFTDAINKKVKFVNYSSYGPDYSPIEYTILKKLRDNNIILITSMGNDGKNLSYKKGCKGSYPACYNLSNIIPVASLDENNKKHYTSNYANNMKSLKWELGNNVSIITPEGLMSKMSGTSPATALYTNKLLKQECLKLHAIASY